MDCPLPCHGLSFLKVSEGLPAGAVGNMCFFFRGWGGGGGGKCLFPTKLKELVIIIYFYLFIYLFFFGGGGVSGPPIPLWIRTSVRNK